MLILNSIDKLFKTPQPYLCILYRTIFITAYYGLFRVGELTNSPHVVKACDIHIGQNKNKLLFVLRSSKTHDEGNKPQIIKINSVSCGTLGSKVNKPDREWYPFWMLKKYIAHRKHFIDDEEPFFVFIL